MLEVGDIVLCTIAGNEYLHLVKAVQDGRYQFINGWIGPQQIYGKLTVGQGGGQGEQRTSSETSMNRSLQL